MNHGLYGRGPKGKADKLFSQVIRSRGGCENCGEQEYAKLQCAHVVSRRFNATRVDTDNAFCLCWTCHRRFTDWPLEFAEFVEKKMGRPAYLALRLKAEAGVKVNDAYWLAECERLKALLPREVA